MKSNIDFDAIYKDFDRKELIGKIIKNIALWAIAILFFLLILGSFLGWFGQIHGRCGYDERIHDYECWEPF